MSDEPANGLPPTRKVAKVVDLPTAKHTHDWRPAALICEGLVDGLLGGSPLELMTEQGELLPVVCASCGEFATRGGRLSMGVAWSELLPGQTRDSVRVPKTLLAYAVDADRVALCSLEWVEDAYRAVLLVHIKSSDASIFRHLAYDRRRLEEAPAREWKLGEEAGSKTCTRFLGGRLIHLTLRRSKARTLHRRCDKCETMIPAGTDYWTDEGPARSDSPFFCLSCAGA